MLSIWKHLKIIYYLILIFDKWKKIDDFVKSLSVKLQTKFHEIGSSNKQQVLISILSIWKYLINNYYFILIRKNWEKKWSSFHHFGWFRQVLVNTITKQIRPFFSEKLTQRFFYHNAKCDTTSITFQWITTDCKSNQRQCRINQITNSIDINWFLKCLESCQHELNHSSYHLKKKRL